MTGQATWIRTLGNTGPPLDFVCRAEPGPGARVGLPRDLTTATSVIGVVRRWSDRAIVESAAATTLGSPINGQVRLPLSTIISTSPGLHGVSFTVTDPAEQRTYPGPLDVAWLLLAAPLVSGAAFTPADPGAPVIIAPSGTGGPTMNGQIVFAGASSTIVVPAGVSWFQLAWSGVGSPWTLGTLPTIVQAGSTVDPGVAGVLLGSDGHLVVITRVGTVLTALATGAGSGGGGSGTSYLHTQSVAATTWTVIHNLGVFTPDVTLADASGLEFLADIDFVDANTLTITSAAPVAGTALIQA